MVPITFVSSTNILRKLDTNPIASQSTRRLRYHQPVRSIRPTWCASKSDSGKTESSADDEILNQELQKKVNELFGGRQNVTINVEADGDVLFNVRRTSDTSDLDDYNAAWGVIRSIIALSLCAGVVFTALYYSGAVHGSSQLERHYEMPTYGSRSYIDPYELLDSERQLQDSQGTQ